MARSVGAVAGGGGRSRLLAVSLEPAVMTHTGAWHNTLRATADAPAAAGGGTSITTTAADDVAASGGRDVLHVMWCFEHGGERGVCDADSGWRLCAVLPWCVLSPFFVGSV